MSHIIRPARSSDVDDMARIHRASWVHAYASTPLGDLLRRVDPADLALDWARAVISPPSPADRVLVAVEARDGAVTGEDTSVGFIALGPCHDPDAAGEAELVALHVAPEAQRQGHGSRLLAAAIDSMTSAGFTEAVCWVPLHEEPRRAFLMSAGWAPDGALRDLAAPDGSLLREVRLVVGFGPEPSG